MTYVTNTSANGGKPAKSKKQSSQTTMVAECTKESPPTGSQAKFDSSKNASSSVLSKIFPSTHYDRDFYFAALSEAIQEGKSPLAPSWTYGYMLIGELLVPLSFVETVKEAIRGFVFENSLLLGAGDMFDKSFLNSLDAYEQRVLMSVVLVLIEQGNVDVNFFPTKEEQS